MLIGLYGRRAPGGSRPRLQAKGPKAVRVTKVKGHATKADVEAGRSTTTHKLGNDIADIAADKAVQQYGRELVDIAAMWADRH